MAAPVATTLDEDSLATVPGPFRRATAFVSELLAAVALVLCLPFVILAIGTPIGLGVRILQWIGEWLF